MQNFFFITGKSGENHENVFGRFGFTLVAINKPFGKDDEIHLRKMAQNWHERLYQFISTAKPDDLSVNLSFRSEGGAAVHCTVFITVYAADEAALNEMLQSVQHDMAFLFTGPADDEVNPYIFHPVTDINMLTRNRESKKLTQTLLYRKPLLRKESSALGFNVKHQDQALNAHARDFPNELFPGPQVITDDTEVFKILMNQKSYTELDIEIRPCILIQKDIDILRRIINNHSLLFNPEHPQQEITAYLTYLKNILRIKRNKFFVSVLLLTEGKKSPVFLTGAISRFLFSGYMPDMVKIKEPAKMNRYKTASGETNMLPFLYSADNVLEAFRLPFPSQKDIPGIAVQDFVFQQHPENLSQEGILVGRKQTPGEKIDVRISHESLARHVYIMGQTGTGKSTLLKTMIKDCLAADQGFTLIDPHGDLFDEILESIPASKKGKVALLTPTEYTRSIKSNITDFDRNYPEQKSLLINELFKIFEQLYDLKSTGGPQFELFFRNGMFAIMDDEVIKWNGAPTLKDFNDFYWDDEYHKKVLASCSNKTVLDFFEKAKKMTGEQSWANWAPYITSKINRLLHDSFVAPFVSTKTKSFDYRNHMDNKNILLIKLDKGKMGGENVSLFGQLLLNQISLAAMSRSDIALKNRKQHFLFIDEFQNFIVGDISDALSELRKYGVSMILANQTLGQLSAEITESIFGNAGNLIFFRPGVNDYDKIRHFHEPDFSRHDVLKLPNFNCIGRLMIDNMPSDPFVFQTIKE